MPPGDDIQKYLYGAWQLLLGRREGMKLLDLSADGFWNSFYAIVLALPAMFVGWVSVTNGFGDQARSNQSQHGAGHGAAPVCLRGHGGHQYKHQHGQQR